MEHPLLAVALLGAALLFSASSALLAIVILRRRHCTSCPSRSDLECGTRNARVAPGEEHHEIVREQSSMPATDKDTVRQLTWREVETLTRNFSPDAVIGEGGSATVFLAYLSSSPVAIKVYSYQDSERFRRAFRQELDLLLRLRHRGLPPLHAYCLEVRGYGALVLPYFANGTLHDKLHGDGGNFNLTWVHRMGIALGVAQALEYMHECDPHIIHGDVKPANVLLTENFQPVLCDLGSAHVGFLAAATAKRGLMVGTPGYVDPHYLGTGVVSKKNDVYSYGVLLLEMITGADAYCEESKRALPTMVGEKGVLLVDSGMRGEYDAGQAAEMGLLALRCIEKIKPNLRPSMSEVVKFIADKIPTASISDY